MNADEKNEKSLEEELRETLAEYARHLVAIYEDIEADPEKMRRFQELTGLDAESKMGSKDNNDEI